MLIIETSTEKSFIATEDAVYFFSSEERESVCLVAAIKKLLGNKKPEAIGVGLGPGAFTGTRVGVIVAKALSFGYKVPLVGFSSLKCYTAEEPYTVAFDAKSRGAYLLDYDGDSPYLGAPNYPVISPHPESLRVDLGDVQRVEPDIAHTLHLAKKLLEEEQTSSPEELSAIYLGEL